MKLELKISNVSASFENKKQENFNKGEAELERRRLELKERERKEAVSKTQCFINFTV